MTGTLSATSAPPRSLQAAAEILVSGFGEPAAVLNTTGCVISTNSHCQRIAHVFEEGGGGELHRLAGIAGASAQVVSAVLLIKVETGQVVYQTTVVPLVLGTNVLFLFHDETREHNLRDALMESRQRYKDLVEVSSDFSWEVDANGLFRFVSRPGALGHAPEDLIGKSPADFVVGAEEYHPLPFLADRVVEDVELWMTSADGSLACLLVSAMPFFDEDGTFVGVRGVCRDVTKERERTNALAQAHQREQILGYIVNTIREEIVPADMLGAAAAVSARALGAQGATVLRVLPTTGEGGGTAPTEQGGGCG